MRPRRFPREEEATLVEHLEELRTRIVVALVAVAIGFGLAFGFHTYILDWLRAPLPENPLRETARRAFGRRAVCAPRA